MTSFLNILISLDKIDKLSTHPNLILFTFYHFSDRLDVNECMNHKWLVDAKSPKIEQTDQQISQEILAVQTTNVTITTIPTESTIVEITETCKSEEIFTSQQQDEDKENTEKCHPNTLPCPAKLVLEKSLSISLFPDAPTTPKVSRKTLYDDENDLNSQVKEIVKKYQSEQKFSPSCCSKENDGECLLHHQELPQSKPPSLELDKGIIC